MGSPPMMCALPKVNLLRPLSRNARSFEQNSVQGNARGGKADFGGAPGGGRLSEKFCSGAGCITLGHRGAAMTAHGTKSSHGIVTAQKQTACIAASRCFYWRPHGDSNPGYRRERVLTQTLP
jgi:hypothetical protein